MAKLKHLLVGSIGALVDTSEIQREAYNNAFKEVGLNWHWDQNNYRQLLEMSGGQKRLRLLSQVTGQKLDDDRIAKIHELKTNMACEMIEKRKPQIRPLTKQLLELADEHGLSTSFVTSTSQQNVTAILKASNLEDRFKVTVTNSDINEGKPSPEPYQKALELLKTSSEACLAIEDSSKSAISAKKANIQVIAYPGENNQDQFFDFCEHIFYANDKIDIHSIKNKFELS